MKKTKLTRSLLAACSIVALTAVMYGCTGDGAENDLKATQGDLEKVQADLDAANARIMELEGDLATANGTISTLQTTIGAMDDAADMDGSLYAQINYHMGVAGGLRTTIGSMDDAADMGGSLHAQINYHMGEVTRISGLLNTANMNIGDPTDAADMNGSLHAQINYHMGVVSGLRTDIGSMDDAADMDGSLYAQINYHMDVASDRAMTIGDPSDEADDSADASLHAQLNAAKAEITRLTNQLTTTNTVNRLRSVASTATTDATTAGMDASQALKDAQKYAGMLGVVAVGGDSAMAMANAQKVLDANQAAIQAVLDATAAKTAAQTAKTDATALPDDTPDKAGIIAALDKAIEAAEDQIKAAMAIRDGDDLEAAVQMVTGTDADDLKNAADRGKEVADDIYAALTTAAQIPATVAIPAAHTTSATVGALVMGDSDARGMTWAQIGGSSLVDMRIAAGATAPAASRAVMAKSVDGMTAGDLGLTTSPGTADGTEVDTDVAYKGIGGVLFCAGTDCEVEDVEEGTFAAATSKLTGSWYFAPDAGSTATYLAGTGDAAGTYSLEAADTYVQYGYWLSVASATDDTVTINRYLSGPAAQTGGVYAIDSTEAGPDAFKTATASYEGPAIGMSVVWRTDTNGVEVKGTRASGMFEADADLTMRFGGTPTLDGTISNFRGNAVGSGWEIDLNNAALASGEVAAGVTEGGGDPGAWTATAWGGSATADEEARPTGVYGAFNAEFTNGAAAGVYATRKQ